MPVEVQTHLDNALWKISQLSNMDSEALVADACSRTGVSDPKVY